MDAANGDNTLVPVPPMFCATDKTARRPHVASLEEYRALLARIEEQVKDEPSATQRRKRARQAARSVLPNATETKIVVTGNARAWRYVIKLRGAEGAEAEIRRLAITLLRVFQAEAPELFGDYRLVKTESGVEVIETDFRGV